MKLWYSRIDPIAKAKENKFGKIEYGLLDTLLRQPSRRRRAARREAGASICADMAFCPPLQQMRPASARKKKTKRVCQPVSWSVEFKSPAS